jgi:hypothetical protein
MAQAPIFSRIVLGLAHHRPSHGMQFAAEMARLLRLDLFGLFVQEESLFGVASLPFAREFKFLGGGWAPLDVEQLSRDLEIAARSAQRAFTDVARTLPTICQFEIIRGSMAETIASVSRAGDIVLLTEPASTDKWVAPQSPAILEAAMRSAAAVLLVPGRIARHTGAVVAIATKPDDPSIAVASAIASAAQEELVVVELFKPAGEGTARAPQLVAGMPVRRIVAVAGSGPANLSEIASVLHRVNERLVVMTRNHGHSPSVVASMRHVPVLIVEPAER